MQNQNIIIVNKKLENFEGFPRETLEEIKTISHVQPLNPVEVTKLTSGTLDSKIAYKFYIIDNLAESLNSLNKTDSLIKWGERWFKVYSKNDWHLNGWIMVIAFETFEGA